MVIFQDYVIGVLDMDSPVLNGFSTEDKKYCEIIVEKLVEKTNFEKLLGFYGLTP